MYSHAFPSRPPPPPPLSARPPWHRAPTVDHLSAMPPMILRNILSRLPAKDAARTTVLSDRWRRVWHSVPLVLADSQLLPSADLAAAVSSALAAHPGPFGFVHLSSTSMANHRAEINIWLELLATKGVKDLVFLNHPSKIFEDLALSTTLFKCKSIIRLYIGFWRFPDTTTLPPAALFPQLRELGLCAALIHERDLSFLIEKCPVLSKLILVGSCCAVAIRFRSRSLQCVQVCTSIVPEISVGHAPRLERLLLWEVWGTGPSTSMCSIIKIGYAPNLRIMGFLVPGMHQLIIGDTLIKAGTNASANTTVPSLEMLAILVNFGAHNEARMVTSFLRCFPNIETLYVQCEHDESSASKRRKGNTRFWVGAGAEPECIQRHMKKVVVRGVQGKASEISFISFICKHAQVLEKMDIAMCPGYTASDPAGKKLRAMFSSMKCVNHHCKVTISECASIHQRTPWCYVNAFDLGNQDPFDVSSCLAGQCVRR